MAAPASASPAWYLAWCHERCFKLESKHMRHSLAQTLRDSGGRLVCLKKPDKFAAWLSFESQAPCGGPLVLLTDWREAKPCMEAIAKQPAEKHPVLTVLLCEAPVQARRALTWAETLPRSSGEVCVCRSFGQVTSILGALLDQADPEQLLTESGRLGGGSQNPAASAEGMPGRGLPPTRPARPQHQSAAASSAASAMTVCGGGQGPMWLAQLESPSGPVPPQPWDPCRNSGMAGPFALPLPSPPLATGLPGQVPAGVPRRAPAAASHIPALQATRYGHTGSYLASGGSDQSYPPPKMPMAPARLAVAHHIIPPRMTSAPEELARFFSDEPPDQTEG